MSIRPFGLFDKSKVHLTFFKFPKVKMNVFYTIWSNRQFKNQFDFFLIDQGQNEGQLDHLVNKTSQNSI